MVKFQCDHCLEEVESEENECGTCTDIICNECLLAHDEKHECE